jgi:NIPSNAP
MTFQLRMYTVKSGAMDQWLREWRERVVPLRVKFGFEVVGAWVAEGTNSFGWVIRYRGPATFEDGDRAYYGSDERSAMKPDPARHLEATQVQVMRSVSW